MSYGIRNTLILLVVLTTFIGAGWGYLYFYQEPKVSELEQQVNDKREELNQKQQTANQYPVLQNRYEKATEYFNNYDKGLYANSNEDNVYQFLNNVSTGSAYTDFTFSFSDSTVQNQFGVLNMQVTGQGYYRNVNNFIRQIELSKPLNKIDEVTISPVNELGSYARVNFNFTLQSFYDRVKLLGEPDLSITNNLLGSIYNPFYPLIRSVQENENNLVDVEQSSIIAISSGTVFLLNQNGVMKRLSTGDEVYLGELSSVDVQQGSATFTLNKGGLVEEVTLTVDNEENQSSS